MEEERKKGKEKIMKMEVEKKTREKVRKKNRKGVSEKGGGGGWGASVPHSPLFSFSLFLCFLRVREEILSTPPFSRHGTKQ